MRSSVAVTQGSECVQRTDQEQLVDLEVAVGVRQKSSPVQRSEPFAVPLVYLGAEVEQMVHLWYIYGV